MINMYNLIIFLHLLGLSLGVGGVIISDVLFHALEKKERPERIIHTFPYLSKIISLGLFILILSGIGLVSKEEDYLSSPIFWVKMFFVVVVIVNGLFLNLKISPKIIKYYTAPHEFTDSDFSHLKAKAYVSGAISLFSWLAAFILGVLL